MSSGPYSYQTGETKTFHIADYTVFGATLAISAFIGIFYAIKDRKKNTTDEYLLAGRSMHPIPVAMSLLSSFISAITILGTPAEVYVYSTMYWWISVAFIITAMGAAHIFIPVFYNLGITSVFEVNKRNNFNTNNTVIIHVPHIHRHWNTGVFVTTVLSENFHYMFPKPLVQCSGQGKLLRQA